MMMKIQLFNLVLLRPRSTDAMRITKLVGDGVAAALRSKHWGEKWSPEEREPLLAARVCLFAETAGQLLL